MPREQGTESSYRGPSAFYRRFGIEVHAAYFFRRYYTSDVARQACERKEKQTSLSDHKISEVTSEEKKDNLIKGVNGSLIKNPNTTSDQPSINTDTRCFRFSFTFSFQYFGENSRCRSGLAPNLST